MRECGIAPRLGVIWPPLDMARSDIDESEEHRAPSTGVSRSSQQRGRVLCDRGRDGCGGGGCGNALSRPRIQDRAALRLAVLPSPVPCLAHIIRRLRRRRAPPPTSASACGTNRACVLEVARAGPWMGWDAMRALAAGASGRRRRGDTCMYERAPRALSPARSTHLTPAAHEGPPHIP
jgi:hypothetical protein